MNVLLFGGRGWGKIHRWNHDKNIKSNYMGKRIKSDKPKDRVSFKFKVEDQIVFLDDKSTGIIKELETDPSMKPYVIKGSNGKEYYAQDEDIKLKK